MKRLLVLFGVLDIITLARSFKLVFNSLEYFSDFFLINLSSIFLYATLISSAYFLIQQNKIGIWFTYIQFPFRMAFFVLSFGFLLVTNHLFNNSAFTYKIILWILIGLEILRLLSTIFIHKKYFLPYKD